MYTVVYWEQPTSYFIPKKYMFFRVNVDKTVNAFARVNGLVEKIANDIETISGNIDTLKQKFETYTGLDEELDGIVTEFKNFRDGLIAQNKLLIDTAMTTCDEIAKTNDNFFNKTQNLKADLKNHITAYTLPSENN